MLTGGTRRYQGGGRGTEDRKSSWRVLKARVSAPPFYKRHSKQSLQHGVHQQELSESDSDTLSILLVRSWAKRPQLCDQRSGLAVVLTHSEAWRLPTALCCGQFTHVWAPSVYKHLGMCTLRLLVDKDSG